MGSDDGKSGNGRVLGIDLGMTSAVAAYVPDTRDPPKIIPMDRGLPSLPAIVALQDGRKPLVGRAGLELRTLSPSCAISGVKRLLGRKAQSQAVKDLAIRVPFKIVSGEDDQVLIRAGKHELTAPEVAGILLDQVRRLAEKHLNERIDQCAIAVPAYFNREQKNALKEAAKLAGFKVRKLVHEPTAVALAYGYNRTGDARIVIIDMGGVRLDVSVMEITGNVFDVVATGGDPYLGGSNIDAKIADWILASIEQKYETDLRKQPLLLQKVHTAAEHAKRELSRVRAVDLQIPLAPSTEGKEPTIGRLRLRASTVEELANKSIGRVIKTIEKTLEARNLKVSDIDDIILVGGATRIPLLRRRTESYFGKKPRTSIPPEQAVALGTALLGDSLKREKTPRTDVLQESVGMALADGRFMQIISKNTKLPTTRRVMIPTVRDNQKTLELDLFEGDAEDIIDVSYLGTIVYQGLESAKAGEGRLIIDMSMDEHRLLTIRSPEQGRDNERFQFETKGHQNRTNGSEPIPRLEVATGMPVPDSEDQTQQDDADRHPTPIER